MVQLPELRPWPRAALALILAVLSALALGADPAGEAPSGAEAPLREHLDRLFSDPALKGPKMSLRVVSVDRGGVVLYSYHAEETLIPASNVKLATTAAALHYLGPQYEFRTVLAAGGPIDADGVLRGDLVVIGGGDPSISGRFFGGDATAVFSRWAEQLYGRGLREVTGDLLGDDRFFDRQYRHPSWPRGQEAYWYQAPIGALSLNDNCVEFTLTPTSPGKPAQLRLNPPTDYLLFRNRSLTRRGRGTPKVLFRRALGSREVLIEGSIPHRLEAVTNYVTVDDPGGYFLTVLAQVLRRRGIRLKGRVRLVEPEETLPPLSTLLEHRSGLLAAIQVANKRSQNFYAEQILKTLGREVSGEGSFARGVEVVTSFLRRAGLDPRGLRLVDGSGLARENRLSARFLTDLLVLVARSPDGDAYLGSLAKAGLEGSLRSRLREPDYRGRVLGKTGTLAGVRALSGYVRTRRGELLAFSFLMNGPAAGTLRARSVQDEALRRLVRY